MKDWNQLAMENHLIAISGQTDPFYFEKAGIGYAHTIVNKMPQKRGNVVLDLGCGIGRISKYISWCCSNIYAVDGSEVMLEKSSEYLRAIGNVDTYLAKDESLDFIKDESLDFAFSIGCFIHCEPEVTERYLESVRRSLKPGCKFYFDVHVLASSPNGNSDRVINMPLAKISELSKKWSSADMRFVNSRIVCEFIK